MVEILKAILKSDIIDETNGLTKACKTELIKDLACNAKLIEWIDQYLETSTSLKTDQTMSLWIDIYKIDDITASSHCFMKTDWWFKQGTEEELIKINYLF